MKIVSALALATLIALTTAEHVVVKQVGDVDDPSWANLVFSCNDGTSSVGYGGEFGEVCWSEDMYRRNFKLDGQLYRSMDTLSSEEEITLIFTKEMHCEGDIAPIGYKIAVDETIDVDVIMFDLEGGDKLRCTSVTYTTL